MKEFTVILIFIFVSVCVALPHIPPPDLNGEVRCPSKCNELSVSQQESEQSSKSSNSIRSSDIEIADSAASSCGCDENTCVTHPHTVPEWKSKCNEFPVSQQEIEQASKSSNSIHSSNIQTAVSAKLSDLNSKQCCQRDKQKQRSCNKCSCNQNRGTERFDKFNHFGGHFAELQSNQLASFDRSSNRQFGAFGGSQQGSSLCDDNSGEDSSSEESDSSSSEEDQSDEESNFDEDDSNECDRDNSINEGRWRRRNRSFPSQCSKRSSKSSFMQAVKKFQSSLDDGYFNTQTCAKVGIKVRKYIPKCLLRELEEKYLEIKCKFLGSVSSWPIDIAPVMNMYPASDLIFDVALIGGGPGTLVALKTFADAGKRVLLIEKGRYAPMKAISLYQRPSLMLTDYVTKIQATAPGCDFPKVIINPNVLGGITTLNYNQWDVGCKKNYVTWGNISGKWCWKNVVKYYDLVESYAKKEFEKSGAKRAVDTITETKISETRYEKSAYSENVVIQEQRNADGLGGSNLATTFSSKKEGFISISKTMTQTKITREVHSAFAEIGLSKEALQISSLDKEEGFSVVPVISEEKSNILFVQKVLELVKGKENVQLAVNTEASEIIFSADGRATGVKVATDSGHVRTIQVRDEVIIGTGAVNSVRLLTQSGIGERSALERLNVPLNADLPYLGRDLIMTPTFFGFCIKFPQGLIVEDTDDDMASMEYLYGQTKICPGATLNFFKAYLKIDSEETNIRVNFHVFSKSTATRLRSYVKGFFHFDSEIEDYIADLCDTHDVLFLAPQLLYTASRGSITVDRSSSSSLHTVIDTGMYRDQIDMDIMMKSIEKLRHIVQTKTFANLQAELVKLPLKHCDEDDLDCYVRYFSTPGLLPTGGLVMGSSPENSVVNEDLILHGTQNVRCFSSAVLPFSLGSESAACSIMIGLHGAEMIAEKYKYAEIETCSQSSSDTCSTPS